MANNYDKIFELAGKNNMGLSNTIKRDYGIPLDYSSVHESYEAALAYAQTSTLAYIGQPISVGDTLYIVTGLEGEAALKAVGTKPTGDDKSITVSEDGVISIYGFTAAPDATVPRKNADGSITWVTLADIAGSTDTNTKTVIEIAEGSALTVSSATTGTTGHETTTYTIDVTLPEYSVNKTEGETADVYSIAKNGVLVGTEIVVPHAYDDTELINQIKALEGTTHFIGVKEVLPETANAGDVCIVGNKEYIYSPESNTDNKWIELGDTSAELERIAALETYKDTSSLAIESISGQINELFANDAATEGVITNLNTQVNTISDSLETETQARETKDNQLESSITALSNKIGTVAENENIVDIINVAKEELETADEQLRADITNNSTIIETLVGGQAGDEQKSIRTIAAEEINALINAADPENGKTIENLAKLVEYVDTNAGELADLVLEVEKHTSQLIDIDGSVADYVTKQISNIPAVEIATSAAAGLVKASEEIAVAEDGTMSIASVKASVINWFDADFVINGGNANAQTTD